MKLPNIFDYMQNCEMVKPAFPISLFSMDNPKRPLTSLEVRQCYYNQYCATGCFIEQEMDWERAEQVLNYIHKLYPILDNDIIFDEELKWLRYEPRGYIPFSVKKPEVVAHSMVELFDVFREMFKVKQQSWTLWRFVGVQVPELKEVKYALLRTVPHAFFGASSSNVLYNLFNKLYSDSTVNFKETPAPQQSTYFRAILAFDKNQPIQYPTSLKINTPSTNLKGDFVISHPHDEPQPGLMHIVDFSKFAKVKNVSMTYVLVASYAAQNAGYGYFHGDIKESEEFTFKTADFRPCDELFRQHSVLPNLDFQNILGYSAKTIPYILKGHKNTTIQELLDQLNAAKFTGEFTFDDWKVLNYIDFSPFRNNQALGVANMSVSNIGKVQFCEGPLKDNFGSNAYAFAGVEQFALNFVTLTSGKYGCCVIETEAHDISAARRARNFDITFMIQQMLKEKGPAGVTIAEIAEIYKKEFEGI